jgi:4-hydroxy-tetrahydrodipicolinate synthase
MTSTIPFRGIIGACLTPFDSRQRIDEAALAREIDFLVPDTDAISIAAVEAAEYTMLTPKDRLALMRRGTDLVGRRRPVILGASSPSVRGALELAEHAAKAGADLIQVLMPLRPWGGPPTTAELVAYFTAIAERSALPIVAYHNPGPGSDPSIEALIQLSEIDRVVAFKESSRDITKIARLIEAIDRAGHAAYFTTMQPLLVTLLMGGAGGTMPPPGTRIGAEVVKAFRAGDLDTAREWQRQFATFPGTWPAYGLPPVMKAAMRHLGVDIGDPLPPYGRVSAEHDAQIGQFLKQAGLMQTAGVS